MRVWQLLHTVVIGTPLSSAAVIQVCLKEYQVRFLPDLMSVFLRSLESPSAQVVSPDSTNISWRPSLLIRSLSALPLLWFLKRRFCLFLGWVSSLSFSRCRAMGADNWYQRPALVFSAGTSTRHQICWSSLLRVLFSLMCPHLILRREPMRMPLFMEILIAGCNLYRCICCCCFARCDCLPLILIHSIEGILGIPEDFDYLVVSAYPYLDPVGSRCRVQLHPWLNAEAGMPIDWFYSFYASGISGNWSWIISKC